MHTSAAGSMLISTPSPSALGLDPFSTFGGYEICTADCRTFLWRGAGVPTYGDDGMCQCSCDGNSWVDHNMLGLPSCVPVAAHMTFGLVGLFISVTGTFHAAFHLHRQARFHEEQASASASPIEKCRHHLHVGALLSAILSAVYFAMVVADEMWLSLVVLGVLQIPVFISLPVLSTRMWIYTNDRQVLQRSPEVLRFSLWLESSVGHYAAYTFVSIPPVGSVVLAIAGRAEAAVGVITLQVLVLAPCLSASFLVLGKSLLNGIDDSLQQQQQRQQQLQAMGVTPEHGKKPSTASSPGRRSSGDLMLLAARKKVKRVVMFAVALPTQTACMLLFAAVTRFGTEAPLLLFFFPMTFTPPIWNIVNVGIHQGRTQLSLSGGGPSFRRPRISSISISSLSWRRRSQQRQVAAVETSTGAPRQEGSGLDR